MGHCGYGYKGECPPPPFFFNFQNYQEIMLGSINLISVMTNNVIGLTCFDVVLSCFDDRDLKVLLAMLKDNEPKSKFNLQGYVRRNHLYIEPNGDMRIRPVVVIAIESKEPTAEIIDVASYFQSLIK